MATIQLKKNLGAAPVAAPAAGAAAEPFFSRAGFTAMPAHAANTNELGIWTGTAFAPLVSPTRQVELIGAQTITGIKTVSGAGAIAFAGVANLTIAGSTPGDHLVAGAGGAIVWSTPAAALIWGIGLTEAPPGTINLDPATSTVIGGVSVAARSITQGLDLAAGGVLTLPQATIALMGGVSLGTAADMDGAAPSAITGVTPGLVRGLVGAPVATLVTNAKTIVPAINELTALVKGALAFAGSYDVVANIVDPIGAGVPGPLPPAAVGLNGRFVICTNAGPGLGNAVGEGPYLAEDWLICGEVPTAIGTYAWHKLSIGQIAMTAANVGFIPTAPMTATNVQDAIDELATAVAVGVTHDVSLAGIGSVGTPLTVAIVDGGTF